MLPSSEQTAPTQTSWRICLLILMGAFIALASWKIDRPGWYYDEMLFVQGALPKSEMAVGAMVTWHGIPIKVFYYIGALKAWIYKPIFSIFGLNYTTMRLPVILLSSITMLVTFFSTRRWLGVIPALLVVTLCVINPSFVMQSRIDWGPVVLMWLCKAVAMTFLFRWLERPTLASGYLWGCLGMMALGFFDKLNFVWVILAYGVATLVVYFPECRKAVQNIPIWIWIILGAFGAVTCWLVRSLIVIFLKAPDISHLGERVADIWQLYVRTNSGDEIGDFWFYEFSRALGWLGGMMIVSALLLLVTTIILIYRKHRSLSLFRTTPELRLALWCLLVWSVIFLEIVLTPQAGGPHHAAVLFPFDALAAVALGKYLYDQFATERRKWVVFFMAGSVIWYVSCGIGLLAFYTRLPDISAHRAKWSPRMSELASFVGSIGNQYDIINAVDWGMSEQLLALTPKPARWKCNSRWEAFRDWSPDSVNAARLLNQGLPAKKKILCILYKEKGTVFAVCRQNFFTMNQLRGNKLDRITNVPPEVDEVYELYSIEKSRWKPAPPPRFSQKPGETAEAQKTPSHL